MGFSQREKYLILLALLIFVPLLLFRFVFFPFSENQKSLTKKIDALEHKTKQISILGQEYNILRKETQVNTSSLTKKIDSILRQYRLKVRSKIVLEEQPKGGQRLIVKLDEIYLSELAKLVYRIENSKPIIMIENIDINPSYKNKKLFRVTLALASN